MKKIRKKAKAKKINLKEGTILTSDIFDGYVDLKTYQKNYPEDLDTLASEMESAILFCIAHHLKKKAAACLITVVDSLFEKISFSREERENFLK